MREKTDLSGAILDGLGAPVCVADAEGHVILWNHAAAVLTGISSERICGHDFLATLLLPSDFDDWRRELERIYEGLPPRYFEGRWKSLDGSLLSLTCSCSVIRDSAGHAQYSVCTVHNNVSSELMTDRRAELKDISRFLHNTITQDLLALSFNVSELESTALELIDRCCRDVRVISCMLSPPLLSENTLEEAIEMYARDVHEEVGLPIAIDIDPVSNTVSPEAQLLLLSAVQSWVGRGIRSRLGPAISVRLRNRGSATALELEMAPGLSMADFRGGWVIIRERARTLGGEFDIAGDSGRVSAKLSLPARANYEHS